MKTDLYTKAVLTVIAFLLLLTACDRYINPPVAVQAEGPFAGVQFSIDHGDYQFFDTRTGDLWEYYAGSSNYHLPPKWTYLGKVTQLGQPLVGGTIPKT